MELKLPSKYSMYIANIVVHKDCKHFILVDEYKLITCHVGTEVLFSDFILLTLRSYSY